MLPPLLRENPQFRRYFFGQSVSFLLGSAAVLFQVAFSGFFQAVVPRERYVEANALLNGSRGFSFVAGTSFGGALVQLLRGPYALVADAGSFLWSALFLRGIDVEEPAGATKETGGVGAGLRWIRDNPMIRAELIGVAALNLFNFVFFALFMLYATRALHVRPATLGLVLGSAAVGTLGAAYLTNRSPGASASGPRSSSAASASPRRSCSFRRRGGRTGS